MERDYNFNVENVAAVTEKNKQKRKVEKWWSNCYKQCKIFIKTKILSQVIIKKKVNL